MTDPKFTISRIAQAAGVNIETVRYYQRRGLVSLPPKRARGFRYYAPETAVRVRFIKRAQALGMSLEEVRLLLKFDSNGLCNETRALTAEKLKVVEDKINELIQLRDTLQDLVAACDASHGANCPIIDSLRYESNSPSVHRV